MKQIILLFLAILLFFSTATYADDLDLLGKLDDLQEHVANHEQHDAGRYAILGYLIDCEFDEACILKNRDKLVNLSKTNRNLIFSGFLKHVDWNKRLLEYNANHCAIDAKKSVRKIYAQCYAEFIQAEKQNPPVNRHIMDVQENDRNLCLKAKIKSLAESGNLFAQAVMLNLAVHFNEKKEEEYWYNKMMSQKDTPAYQLYMKCSELP